MSIAGVVRSNIANICKDALRGDGSPLRLPHSATWSSARRLVSSCRGSPAGLGGAWAATCATSACIASSCDFGCHPNAIRQYSYRYLERVEQIRRHLTGGADAAPHNDPLQRYKNQVELLLGQIEAAGSLQ